MATITEFAKQLRKIRIDRNMIQKEMAKGIGISSVYLSDIEIGKRRLSDKILIKILDFLNLPEKEEKLLKMAAANSQQILIIRLNNISKKDQELVKGVYIKSIKGNENE